MRQNTLPPILELLCYAEAFVWAGVYGTDCVAESIARRASHDGNRA